MLPVDPGDMKTQMHQDAFPGEDISDRPAPEESVPGLTLLDGTCPSGRYRAPSPRPDEVACWRALDVSDRILDFEVPPS